MILFKRAAAVAVSHSAAGSVTFYVNMRREPVSALRLKH